MKLLLLFLLISFNGYTQLNKISKIDSLVNEAIDMGLFSGTVIIQKDDKIVYNKTYGYIDWDKKTAIDTNTIFSIGSITKSFTKEIINQLVKEQKLNYEDKLADYIPYFNKSKFNQITINHLLEMKSGIEDHTNRPDYIKSFNKEVSIDDIVSFIKLQPLLFKPGSEVEYSNSNYILLGAIIEKLTGKKYQEVVKERILQPLKFNNIYVDFKTIKGHPHRAIGTKLSLKGEQKVDYTFEGPQPDGEFYATTNDLLKFANAIKHGNLPSGYKKDFFGLAGGSEYHNSIIMSLSDGYVIAITANIGNIADMLGQKIFNLIDGKPDIALKYPPKVALYKRLKEEGIEEVKNNIKEIVADFDLPYDDRFLNWYGYQLLKEDETDLALEVFTLNTELFPKVPNVWDSLAEGYYKKGDKEKAVFYYNKVLEIDPKNKNAQKMLKEIE